MSGRDLDRPIRTASNDNAGGGENGDPTAAKLREDLRKSAHKQIEHGVLLNPLRTQDANQDPREPVPGTGGLLVRGTGTAMFGIRGGGKTIVALTVALGAAMAGERVLYLDYENGGPVVLERVTDAARVNGWDLDDVWRGFVGRHYPKLKRDWDPVFFGEWVADQGFTVVIYDSVRRLMSQLGSDNTEEGFTAVYDLTAGPLEERGITPVYLDNVGHKNRERPRGTSAKLDATPLGYLVHPVEPFGPDEAGTIEITCERNRIGTKQTKWGMQVGGGTWEIPVEGRQPDTTEGRILAVVSEYPDGATYRQIADRAGMSESTAARHAKRMADGDNPSVTIRSGGPGNPSLVCEAHGEAGI